MFFCPLTGFHVEFDMSKAPGHRVQSLSILCTKCRVPLYEPVQDDLVYKVVLPSYLVTGGDGFSMVRDEKLKHNSGEAFRTFTGCLSELWKVVYIFICFFNICLFPFVPSRGFGHFSCVQLHFKKKASLSICWRTNQDLQLSVWTTQINCSTGFTALDSVWDHVRLDPSRKPDFFYIHMSCDGCNPTGLLKNPAQTQKNH